MKMAVSEINRRAQAIQAVRVIKRVTPQIFISHSSISKKLFESIKKVIESEKVKPFVAKQRRYKINLAEKVFQGINDSDALFAVLTKNTIKKPRTRDWILLEIGLAKGLWKNAVSKASSQYKVYVWKDVNLKIPKDSPLNIIEEYKTLKINSKKSRDVMLEEMKNIAHSISIKYV
jgi:hypothetical protein